MKGQGGVRYVQPRIESIARFLRQKEIPVRYAELCFEKVRRDGKADWCYKHKVHGILDDSDDIIAECRHRGHFAVQVDPRSRSIRDAIFALRLELQNSSHEEFLRHFPRGNKLILKWGAGPAAPRVHHCRCHQSFRILVWCHWRAKPSNSPSQVEVKVTSKTIQ